MATSLVQKKDGTSASTTSLVITMDGVSTAGNTIIVATGNNAGFVSSITGGGATFSMVARSGSHEPSEIWMGVVSGTPGAAITINFPSAARTACKVMEWQGTLATDQTNSGTGTSTTLNPGTVTPPSDNELVIATGCIFSAISAGPTGGFTDQGTVVQSPSTFNIGVGSLIETVALAANTTWTSSSSPWDAVIASFMTPAGGPTGTSYGGQVQKGFNPRIARGAMPHFKGLQQPRGYVAPVAPGTHVYVAGIEITSFLLNHSMTMKLNMFDFGLVNPSYIPQLGDSVSVIEPAWTGTVVSVQQQNPPAGTTKFYTITATNTAVGYASAATIGLSDVPNYASTYGYDNLSLINTTTATGSEQRGTATIFVDGLWPAMTFTLTSANFGLNAAQFTVRDLTVTWPTAGQPNYTLEFGDPMVTLSAWINTQSQNSVLPIDSTKITDGAVTTPKLAANAVTANELAAGSITADKLAATLVLASTIKTADTGVRVEIDSAGVRDYGSSDELLVNIPTDGSAVYVKGQIQATSLTVTGNADLQGTANTYSKLSATTIQAGVQPPSSAPVLVKSWLSLTQLPAPFIANYVMGNGYRDTAGGADGATTCWVAVVSDNTNHNIKVYEWKMSNGVLSRTTTLTGSAGLMPTPTVFTAGNGGITRIGSNWYVTVNGGITRYVRNTGINNSVSSNSSANRRSITTDGVSLFAYDATGPNIATYDSGVALTSITNVTGLGSHSGSNTLLYADIGSGGRFWVGSNGNNRIYEVNSSTFATVANTDFPVWQNLGTGATLYWDGTNFGMYWPASFLASTQGIQFSNWTWTTASAIYWVAYSWYDSAGTVHETAVGPRQSITMDRRMQMNVTTATIPIGGVDDPNNVRVYMAPNATDPGAGNFKLQVTDALTSHVFTTYASGGAADGTGVAFVGGTGGTLASAGTGWTLRGNGSMNLGGASFPGSPVTNDYYFRTDLGLDFYYDGTRWLSSTLFTMPMASDSNAALAATTAQSGRVSLPTQSGGSDIYIVDHYLNFFVVGGTALAVGQSWTGTFEKVNTSNVTTTITTDTINSGASSVWRRNVTSVNALVTYGTYFLFSHSWTKVGTPGNLLYFAEVSYRIVAT